MSTPQLKLIKLFTEKILPKVHLISIAISVAGLILHSLKIDGGALLIMLGFSLLASVYFLTAIYFIEISGSIKPSLYATLVFKLIYIACSVTIIGSLLELLKFEGGKQQLTIGCGALTIGLLIAVAFITIKQNNLVILKKPILHGIAILILGGYILFKSTTL
jgi:hypothetical protein